MKRKNRPKGIPEFLPRSVSIPVFPGPSDSVRVSFKHTQINKGLCLSTCTADQIRGALNSLRIATSLSWPELFQTGRKGAGKTGLNFEKIPTASLKVARPSEVSEDETILSIRASGRFRILGYRRTDAFHILWFDPNHSAY